MAISIADLIKQNTLGQSDGFPLGVPTSYNWYQGWNGEGLETPPANFTALAGWGQVYQEVGQPADLNPNAAVQVANAQTYVHIKATGQWVLVENQSATQLTGGHFATDFAGNTATTMTETPLAGGGVSFDAPTAAYNDHFWHTSRGTYAAGTVDAVYVQMDMRVTDPNEHVVAMVGADWWRDASAPFVADHSTNPGVGGSNWVELSTQWQTVGYDSMSTAQFAANLPPPLSAQAPPVVSPDTLAPSAPQITASTPDAGTVGDTPVTSPPASSSNNLLVNGSFEDLTLAAYDTGRWGAFSSVPGWNAISGSAIELWNNLVGVDATNGQNFGELDYLGAQDGFYQDVKTVAGQNYDLSFDARSRPGFTSYDNLHGRLVERLGRCHGSPGRFMAKLRFHGGGYRRARSTDLPRSSGPRQRRARRTV